MSKDLVSVALLRELKKRHEQDRDAAQEQVRWWRDRAVAAEGAIAALDEVIQQMGEDMTPYEDKENDDG